MTVFDMHSQCLYETAVSNAICSDDKPTNDYLTQRHWSYWTSLSMATISTTQSRLKFLSLWSSDDANKGDDNTAMNVASFPSVCSFLCSNDQQMLRGRVQGRGGVGWGCLTLWHKVVWSQCLEQCESYNWRCTLSLKVVVEITVNGMKLTATCPAILIGLCGRWRHLEWADIGSECPAGLRVNWCHSQDQLTRTCAILRREWKLTLWQALSRRPGTDRRTKYSYSPRHCPAFCA